MEIQNGLISTKSMLIFCVSFVYICVCIFFCLCTIRAKVTAKKRKVGQRGSGDMLTPPSSFWTKKGANRWQSYVYRLYTFVYTFFSFVCQPFPCQEGWKIYKGGKFKMVRFPLNPWPSFVYRLCWSVRQFFLLYCPLLTKLQKP